MEMPTLESILEMPTLERSEHKEPTFETSEITDPFSSLEFEDEIEQEEELEEIPQGKSSSLIGKVTEASARESAEIVLSLLDTFNGVSLTPLARWKLRKKQGGSKVVSKMQALFLRKVDGDKLTAEEETLSRQYKQYLADKEEMEKSIPFTEDERKKLIQSMTVYFKQINYTFKGGNSFWLELGMIEGMKIINVLTI